MIRKVKVNRGGEEIEEYVAEERDLKIIVNDREVAALKLSPCYIEEAAIGYCFGEGLIKSLDSIKKIETDAKAVRISADSSFGETFERYISTDCISGWRTRRRIEKIQVTSNFKVKRGEILEKMRQMQKKSELWRKTGAVHTVGIVNGTEFLAVEDVSRHIAVDKIIGIGVKRGIDFSESYILTSGRLPGDMVIKAARMNVPLIASRTAPIYSGVECAEETNLTLIGFVRANRMNIYTHPWRVID